MARHTNTNQLGVLRTPTKVGSLGLITFVDCLGTHLMRCDVLNFSTIIAPYFVSMKFAFSMFVLKLTLRGVFEMRIKVN